MDTAREDAAQPGSSSAATNTGLRTHVLGATGCRRCLAGILRRTRARLAAPKPKQCARAAAGAVGKERGGAQDVVEGGGERKRREDRATRQHRRGPQPSSASPLRHSAGQPAEQPVGSMPAYQPSGTSRWLLPTVAALSRTLCVCVVRSPSESVLSLYTALGDLT